MTKREFLALRVETQDMVIHEHLGKTGMPAKHVNGDGNAFFEMWDALPTEENTLTELSACPIWTLDQYDPPRDDDWRNWTGMAYGIHGRGLHIGWQKNRNLAVALALLRCKGVIEE